MICRLVTLGLAAGIVALAHSAGQADPSSPAVQELRQSPSVADAESEYNRGVRARVAKDWAAAEALRLRPDFPEALEYLGEAYVKMGRLDDARRILDRLRPLDAERAQELAEEIAQAK